jgi:cyclophilin family peptidyl-prolyl cis-trans isomerase/HEAT repeat protein
MALRDEDAGVRRSAALAMGLTGDPSLAAEVLARVRSDEPDAGVLAAAASAAVRLAGDRAWSDDRYAALFDHDIASVRRAAFRSVVGAVRGWENKPTAPPDWLRRALDTSEKDPVVRACAASVVRRTPRDPADGDLHAMLVAGLLSGPDADVRAAFALALDPKHVAHDLDLEVAYGGERVGRVRAWMAAALGRTKSERGTTLLVRMLDGDPDHTVRAAAAGSLGRRGAAVGRNGVRALSVAARGDRSRFVRVEALGALHSVGGDSVREVLLAAMTDEDSFERAAAAGPLLALDELRVLAGDPVVRVRASAVGEAGARGREGMALCLDALFDGDPVVVAVAASSLGEMGAIEARGRLAELLAGHPSPTRAPDGTGDVRAAALEALGLLDRETAREHAARLLGDADPLVRGAAAAILADPGPDAPPPVTPAGPRIDDFPARRDLRVRDGRRVRVTTDRGTFVVQTVPEEAPVSVARFLARVRNGDYDGTVFHRIVSNFVIQGGDPRGDGWGNGGSPWRQEFSGLPYERGTLGVPRSSEPDSGGCQLFFCHGRTPHLEQQYTITGFVVKGLEVIDRVDLGDRILRARVE